jgi:hypothetical protein
MFDTSLYSAFKYPIHTLRDGESAILAYRDLAQAATVFGSKEGMHPDLDPDFVMRYIILMYTPGTPAYDQHKDIGKRKTWVMSELNVMCREDGTYPPQYNELLTLSSPGVRKKVATFLRLQHPTDWAIMCEAEERLYALIESESPKELNQAVTRGKLIEDARKRLEEATERIAKYDASLALEITIHEFRAQLGLGIRIEEIVSLGLDNIKPHLQNKDVIFPDVRP